MNLISITNQYIAQWLVLCSTPRSPKFESWGDQIPIFFFFYSVALRAPLSFFAASYSPVIKVIFVLKLTC